MEVFSMKIMPSIYKRPKRFSQLAHNCSILAQSAFDTSSYAVRWTQVALEFIFSAWQPLAWENHS